MAKLTPERMRELVIAADRDVLCAEMEPLTEMERQGLADAAIKLAVEVDKYCNPFDKHEIPAETKEMAQQIRKGTYPCWRSPRWASQLFLVGLCDCDVIKNPHKYDIGWVRTDLRDMQQRMLQVLDVRRPKWLADWLTWEWKQEIPVAGWYLERGLIRSGALPPNDTPEYYARMAAEDRVLQSEYNGTQDTLPLFKDRRAMLEADPQLFEHDIWRLLETDTVAFRYAQFGWPDLLLELSQAGILDRAKLIDRCIHGMSLPLSVMTLGGLVKLHDQLSPSIKERQQQTQGYLRLLHQNHSGVVSLAVGALDKLYQADLLPIEEYAQHVSAVFTLEKKGAVKAAIKLANLMCWKTSYVDVRLRISRAVLGGLQHADPDIQKATIELMQWWAQDFDAALTEEIASLGENLANAVKPDLKKLLAQTKHATSSASPSASPTSPAIENSMAAEVTTNDLPAKKAKGKGKAKENETEGSEAKAAGQRDQADPFSDIPELLRQQSQLDAAIEAAKQNAQPLVLPVAKHVPPRRDPARTIQPIADSDELIAAVSAVMQNPDDSIELERCMDGILRLRFAGGDDFEKRSAALHKSVTKRFEKYHPALDRLTEIGFMSIVARWLRIPLPRQTSGHQWYKMRHWFLRQRCHELDYFMERYQDRAVPMLALPTHRDGWIDPETLVTRINEHYAKHRVLLCDCDLTQAILRLTPDGRAEALKRHQKPDHYNGGLELNYALGDDLDLPFNARMSMVQLAAVRARMISLAEKNYEPALPIAQARLDDEQRIIVSGALIEDPTVPFSLWEKALSFSPRYVDVTDPKSDFAWQDRWEALTNPMDQAAYCLAGRISPLSDPEATWTPEACRLAVLAASHDRDEVRIEATDALIEAVERLLVVPELLGCALANNLSHIKLNRVAKVLAEAARPSLLHHWVTLQALEACVTHLSSLPADIHLLLSQMLDSATTLEMGVQEATQTKLSALDAKSKSGKLAKQLQKLRSSEQALATIHDLVIERTATRARRWQSLAPKPPNASAG